MEARYTSRGHPGRTWSAVLLGLLLLAGPTASRSAGAAESEAPTLWQVLIPAASGVVAALVAGVFAYLVAREKWKRERDREFDGLKQGLHRQEQGLDAMRGSLQRLDNRHEELDRRLNEKALDLYMRVAALEGFGRGFLEGASRPSDRPAGKRRGT